MAPVPEENCLSPSTQSEKTLFLLGGYTDKSVLAHAPEGGEGDGVYSVLLDPEAGILKTLSSSTVKTNPAFIMKHPTLDIVYMTTEVIADCGSEVLVGQLDRKTGRVSVLERKKVHGRSTCHLEWDSSRTHIIAVSYWDSKITTFPVDSATGLLGDAKQVYADPGGDYVDKAKPDRWEHLAHRQRWPHLHQVNRDPYSKQFFMVPDLGRDQIHMFNIQQGEVQHLGVEQLRKGAGPRHMDFNKQKKVVYICGELDNTITVLRYNPDKVSEVLKGQYKGDSRLGNGESLLEEVQVVSTVPEDLDRKSTIAEMRLHPSGKFLYVGNRGHNSIAVFSVNQEDGSLTRVAIQDSLGAFPRHFNFDNTAAFLLVGNHASDTIVAFRLNRETGLLELADKVENLPSIVWVTPVTPEE